MIDTKTLACVACGAEIVQEKRGGRNRRWCSQRCRAYGFRAGLTHKPAPKYEAPRPASPSATNPGWAQHGACVGHPYPEWWDGEDEMTIPMAKAVCAGCPVIADCAAEARSIDVTIGASGIWAGMTAAQRNAARRKR